MQRSMKPPEDSADGRMGFDRGSIELEAKEERTRTANESITL